MKNVRVDGDGELRCWSCGNKTLLSKRTFRSKLLVGVGALLTKKKLKCQTCGEYNDTGNAEPFTGPESRKWRRSGRPSRKRSPVLSVRPRSVRLKSPHRRLPPRSPKQRRRARHSRTGRMSTTSHPHPHPRATSSKQELPSETRRSGQSSPAVAFRGGRWSDARSPLSPAAPHRRPASRCQASHSRQPAISSRRR